MERQNGVAAAAAAAAARTREILRPSPRITSEASLARRHARRRVANRARAHAKISPRIAPDICALLALAVKIEKRRGVGGGARRGGNRRVGGKNFTSEKKKPGFKMLRFLLG